MFSIVIRRIYQEIHIQNIIISCISITNSLISALVERIQGKDGSVMPVAPGTPRAQSAPLKPAEDIHGAYE